MTHKASPEQWEHIEQYGYECGYDSRLLELRDRIAELYEDAIEESKANSFVVEAIVRRIEALEAATNLQQQDEDAERAMAPAPAGGLVERVQDVLGHYGDATARAAIMAVAEWLEQQENGFMRSHTQTAHWLRKEVERG